MYEQSSIIIYVPRVMTKKYTKSIRTRQGEDRTRRMKTTCSPTRSLNRPVEYIEVANVRPDIDWEARIRTRDVH